MKEKNTQQGQVLETAQQTKIRLARQRKRSIALALFLVALVVFFYLFTLLKTGPELFSRAL